MRNNTICLILIALVLFGYFAMNKNFNNTHRMTENVYDIPNSEINLSVGTHDLIDTTKKLFGKPDQNRDIDTYIFKPSPDWLHEYKIDGQHTLKLLKNRTNANKITGEYIFDNHSTSDKLVTLIALQGNKNATLKVKGNQKWSNAVRFTAISDSTTKIPLEINWDQQGPEELTLINIKDQYFNQSGMLVKRLVVINKEEKLTKEMIDKQSLDIDNVDDNKFKIRPVPNAIDEENVKLQLYKREKMVFTSHKMNAITLSHIPYSAFIDILWVDEFGNVKTLESKQKLMPNQENKVTFSTEMLDFFYSNNQRQFLLFLNNREQDMLADYKVVSQKLKPFSTSFSIGFEIYPLLKDQQE